MDPEDLLDEVEERCAIMESDSAGWNRMREKYPEHKVNEAGVLSLQRWADKNPPPGRR